MLGNRSALSQLQSAQGHPHLTNIPHPTTLSLSIPHVMSGAGESCLASVQLTVTGKPVKALEFLFSLVFLQGNQLIWLWGEV